VKKIVVVVLIIGLAIAGAYFVFRHAMRTDLKFNSYVSDMVDKAASFFKPAADAIKGAGNKLQSLKVGAQGTSETEAKDSGKAVTIYLKHGKAMDCAIVRKTWGGHVVSFKGQEFVVQDSQIARIEHKTEKEIAWPYKNDIAVRKKNGVVCDGKITNVAAGAVTLSLDESGGAEMDIPRADIDYLIFAPVCNVETGQTERNLKKLFPRMTVYKYGNITLFTDSYVKKANVFMNILRHAYTEVYLEFYGLFRDRKPVFQNFVVVFDDVVTYVESTGVGPFIPGFFDPPDKTLYLYDMWGDRIETMTFRMLTNVTGAVDKSTEAWKKRVDPERRYDEVIDGWAKEFKDRFWKMFNMYKRYGNDTTKEVLRHELTHEIFHNWGLQSVIISRPKVDKNKLVEKKKEFIETGDWKKKKQLLDQIMKIEKSDEIDATVANSWLAEGLATYCETDPIGSVNNGLLYSYQDAAAKNKLNPIEFLTNFEKGSFVGITNEAKYNSYAQSWILTNFLMAKYPLQFIDYQKKMAASKTSGQDSLEMLLKSLNMSLPQLEKELAEYAKTYPKAEDPFVKRYMEHYSIWEDLLRSHV
jgi:hypothetical protein